MKDIPSNIQPLARKAWIPIVEEGDGEPAASKFSGTPFLAEGQTWPACPNCGKPMQLFLQLNLDKLPDPARGEFGKGILQMFYCTSVNPLCEDQCEAYFPFAKSALLRIVPTGNAGRIEIPEIEGRFPPKLITGWKEVDDYPNYEEIEEQGVELTEEESDEWSEQEFPRGGDKLGGWPHWVQGVEYPDCPTCGERMRLVFQIDSEDNLPYMFGDVGCGHITQCRTHTDQLAFGWACS